MGMARDLPDEEEKAKGVFLALHRAVLSSERERERERERDSRDRNDQTPNVGVGSGRRGGS